VTLAGVSVVFREAVVAQLVPPTAHPLDPMLALHASDWKSRL